MPTTDLTLDPPGSLPRPGPVGRLARLGLGIACLWYVHDLIRAAGDLMTTGGSIRPLIWNGAVVGLFLVSYVVNIGFSRVWKKWPAIISAILMAFVAGAGYALTGTIESKILARFIWLWELYVFAHLGTAFIAAAAIATPGCEMRAFHDLYSRLTGVPTGEHECPVGPLHAIDQWERRRLSLRVRAKDSTKKGQPRNG